ncbi:MAG TPA: bifunctional 2-polyprenyl-6-hydroxyphenol methylase/3-demethylubiquinol 3-O-methyltransferase UbiG [Geminicoccaceae bacterium]|nr:bifunctional 2-polyprenyl-6-hydroxyphenol methylase/3-demethylubiquinol 3-O-methyltransferase UbiG [Geminicoccus sp.]HMU50688.1 bifunctional 2-polyprenyl-6-hydroxyphenol methylase/3-demethylubiquinol 3-O-methyltransferase UbiG [Geminicoccaceae bacterium]
MVETAVAGAGSVEKAELDKFRGLAERWWDPDGPMRPLHRMNPCRVGWIRAELCRQLGLDAAGRRPLAGLAVLDIGCGGGLMAEPLARMGAVVTGLDPAAENVETAAWHAGEVGLAIDYRAGTAEETAAGGARFQVVLALEVVEHTPDADAFLGTASSLLAPGGLLVLSTLSRTWRAWLLGIVAAERLLGWLPAGTHDWHRFVRPSEMARSLRRHGLGVTAITGIAWDAATDGFSTVRDTSVNYMLTARRP